MFGNYSTKGNRADQRIEEEIIRGTFEVTGTVLTTAKKTSGRHDRNV